MPNDSGHLIIDINNIKSDKGIIWVGIYDSKKNYLIKEQAIIERLDVQDASPKQKITIKSLKYGEYAIALFHDLNGNGELDRNFFGIPSEPFAFSKKPRSRWRLPRFDEIKFEFKKDKQVLPTNLQKW